MLCKKKKKSELKTARNIFIIRPHLLFGLRPSGCDIINKLYDWVRCTQEAKEHTHIHPYQRFITHSHTHSPEVADFPCSGVEECRGDKQAREAAPIEPGSHAMPLVHRQEVEHRPAHKTWEDPQLQDSEQPQHYCFTWFFRTYTHIFLSYKIENLMIK